VVDPAMQARAEGLAKVPTADVVVSGAYEVGMQRHL